MKVYSIKFNMETFKVEANTFELDFNDSDEQYKQLVTLLGSTGLDVLDYNDDIGILVDDRGFERINNPVFEVITEDGIIQNLAGKLLFVRNVYNEESTDFGSLTSEDVIYLRDHLQIKLKGVLKNTL